MSAKSFGFHRVVGQEDAKLALTLAAADPKIGGVLLRGHKGSAKTTLARGLAELLPNAPFVELPLGATEDRLVGTIDTTAALSGEGIKFQPGLLAEAHGGVLYVDEINLLADHLVDTLLDVAASGENIVERDGLSHRHPARFVLIGSMNPEEGELRPQLLDRFGFCVEITAPTELATRVQAVATRLHFDGLSLGNPPMPNEHEARLLPKPGQNTARAAISQEILEAASRLALEVGAEGLRADIALCRAAATLAELQQQLEVTEEELRRVAPLVLAHRSRRGPFDPPTLDEERLNQALETAFDQPSEERNEETSSEPHNTSDESTDGNNEAPVDNRSSSQPQKPMALGQARTIVSPPPREVASSRGRFVRDLEHRPGDPVAVLSTVRSFAQRRSADPTAEISARDLRSEQRSEPAQQTIVICVDLSGSMGAQERSELATGVVLGLLGSAYQQRYRVALVTFAGEGADLALSPTSSVEVARNRLHNLSTGGPTPLAEGLSLGQQTCQNAARSGSEAHLMVITDGRATGDANAMEGALAAARKIRDRGIQSTVLDCESGAVRLGLAETLATAMGAYYQPIDQLESAKIVDLITTTNQTH
ncbi:MAG: ATP-binding protein [Acidimicrobiia bacterium]